MLAYLSCSLSLRLCSRKNRFFLLLTSRWADVTRYERKSCACLWDRNANLRCFRRPPSVTTMRYMHLKHSFASVSVCMLKAFARCSLMLYARQEVGWHPPVKLPTLSALHSNPLSSAAADKSLTSYPHNLSNCRPRTKSVRHIGRVCVKKGVLARMCI